MKSRVIRFLKTYFLFVLLFVLQKPLFMLWYHSLYSGISIADYFRVMAHGLKLDASMAGYLTLIPGLILIASLWIRPNIIQMVQKIYFGIIAFLLSGIFVADLGLYKYWGFRLDSTPLFYMESPKNAMASVNWPTIAGGIIAILAFSVLFYYLFYQVLIRIRERDRLPYHLLPSFLILLLFTATLFIPIRGGFTVSTMNVGKVYFSSRLALNHAAINPCFSLMESLTREQNFNKQYRFMPDADAHKEFMHLTDQPANDSVPNLFTIRRPNIILVILESFMSKVVEPLGGLPDVAVRLNQWADKGILFTNFYANSFRTDRGLVCILSGYPAPPTTSVMKYPRKSQTLPSIPKTLKEAGYDLQYYYGGDADFTNMRSYLMSCGIEKIVSDQDFPLKDRLSKWGALDGVLFSRLASDIKHYSQSEPFMKIVQTSSSHEPFEVPYRRLDNPYLNSVAYADSCLGAFIDQYRQTEYWKNSIIVMVPDHAMRYPENLDNHDVERYQIPLLIIGGAVKAPLNIGEYASQIDMAATLLAQLDIPHQDFIFSKNILNPASPHFAYFTSPNLFGMVTEENQLVYDCESGRITTDEGEKKGENLKKGKAFLQVLYDDLAKR